MVQELDDPPVKPSHPFFQPRVLGVSVLDVVDPRQDQDPEPSVYRPVGHHHIPRLQGDGPFPSPSEQTIMSRAKRVPSTDSISRWTSFGRIASEVAPERPRTTRTGTCYRESPRFAARSRLFSGLSRKSALVACRFAETRFRRFRQSRILSGPSNRRTRPGISVGLSSGE